MAHVASSEEVVLNLNKIEVGLDFNKSHSGMSTIDESELDLLAECNQLVYPPPEASQSATRGLPHRGIFRSAALSAPPLISCVLGSIGGKISRDPHRTQNLSVSWSFPGSTAAPPFGASGPSRRQECPPFGKHTRQK